MFSEKSKPKDFCWATFKIVRNAFKIVLNEVDGFQSAVHRAIVIGSERGSNRDQDEFRCRFDKLDFYLKTFERPENFVDLEKK